MASSNVTMNKKVLVLGQNIIGSGETDYNLLVNKGYN